MLIETALMTYLLAQTGITIYVGRRIYFVQAPQEVEKPYIVLEKLDSSPVPSRTRVNGLHNSTFRFAVFSPKYGEAKNISQALFEALDSYDGVMGGDDGLLVTIPQRDDESDYYDTTDNNTRLFEVDSDYQVWHREQ